MNLPFEPGKQTKKPTPLALQLPLQLSLEGRVCKKESIFFPLKACGMVFLNDQFSHLVMAAQVSIHLSCLFCICTNSLSLGEVSSPCEIHHIGKEAAAHLKILKPSGESRKIFKEHTGTSNTESKKAGESRKQGNDKLYTACFISLLKWQKEELWIRLKENGRCQDQRGIQVQISKSRI